MLPMNRRADRFSAGDEAWFCGPSPRIAARHWHQSNLFKVVSD
jgi:hypothetical protein